MKFDIKIYNGKKTIVLYYYNYMTKKRTKSFDYTDSGLVECFDFSILQNDRYVERISDEIWDDLVRLNHPLFQYLYFDFA
jgi:hypothetical protein